MLMSDIAIMVIKLLFKRHGLSVRIFVNSRIGFEFNDKSMSTKRCGIEPRQAMIRGSFLPSDPGFKFSRYIC